MIIVRHSVASLGQASGILLTGACHPRAPVTARLTEAGDALVLDCFACQEHVTEVGLELYAVHSHNTGETGAPFPQRSEGADGWTTAKRATCRVHRNAGVFPLYGQGKIVMVCARCNEYVDELVVRAEALPTDVEEEPLTGAAYLPDWLEARRRARERATLPS